jgi:ABC-type uncharacterized transport system involved in gliding motility auxiliary subunit
VKKNSFLLQLRQYNVVWLIGSLVLMLGGIFLILIFNQTWWNTICFSLGVLGLIIFLMINLTQVKETGKQRTTLARANLTLVAIAFLAILCAVNYIAARHPIRADLTADKLYTLSNETLRVLKKLKGPVIISFFGTSNPNHNPPQVAQAKQLLREYQEASNKIHLDIINVDKNPSMAQEYGVTQYNTVVFESGGHRQTVQEANYLTYAFDGGRPTPQFSGESAFTTALFKLENTKVKTIYFTIGHGEEDIMSPEPNGMNAFRQDLQNENYVVKTINLLTQSKIPQNAAAIFIAGPRKPFQFSEIQLLQNYLKQGGKLILCLAPLVPTADFEPILRDFGIKYGNNVVEDPTRFAYPDIRSIIPQYEYSKIVNKLSNGNIFSILPFTRSVQTVKAAWPGVVQTVFLESTIHGWGDSTPTHPTATFRPGIDLKGPVPVAVSCNWTSPKNAKIKSRVVFYGGSDFLTNQLSQAPGNLNLAMNTVDWVTLNQSNISIRPKTEQPRMMMLSNHAENVIYYLSVWILPLLVLAFGGWVWYKRRAI